MPAVNADLNWAIEDVRARQVPLALYKAYDEGDHRLLFATEKYRNTFGDLFREFADNLCDDVVDAITDRLQIISWTTTGTSKELGKAADRVWVANQGEARSGALFRNGFRDGDGFAIVQVNSRQEARWYKQDPRLMAIRYSVDSPDELELAAKVWKDVRLGRYRVNLYYQDRTEKWASRGMAAAGGLPKAAAFKLLTSGDKALASDQEAIMEHDDLPVYHFPNGELSGYGRSILHGVIPIQDALNKSIADMLVTMEAHAAPLRWASGVSVEIDPVTGKEKDPFTRDTRVPGSVLRTGAKEARFGQFEAAQLEGFLAVQDAFKLEAARKGAMPPYTMTLRTGAQTLPSGVSMLVAEGRTIKLARDRHRDWGSELRRMQAHVLRLDLGTQSILADDLGLEWAPPETRDMKALLEELLIKRDLGVPERQLLLEAGYDSEEVEKFLAEAEVQSEDELAALRAAQGGRQTTTRGQAQTLGGALGVPAGPVPPGGGTALAQA